MHLRPASARLITALAIISIVALVLPTLVAAAPVPVSVVTTSTDSAGALLQTATTHAASAVTAAVAAEAAAKAAAVLAEQQRAAAAAAAAYTAARATAKKPASKVSGGNELAQAQSILASLRARYPRYLSGVTVSMGSARGYQAISYYTAGRIVISPTHRASLERILGHEIWHVIDWRDNGRIDWGERVPPSNAASYR